VLTPLVGGPPALFTFVYAIILLRFSSPPKGEFFGEDWLVLLP